MFASFICVNRQAVGIMLRVKIMRVFRFLRACEMRDVCMLFDSSCADARNAHRRAALTDELERKVHPLRKECIFCVVCSEDESLWVFFFWFVLISM